MMQEELYNELKRIDSRIVKTSSWVGYIDAVVKFEGDDDIPWTMTVPIFKNDGSEIGNNPQRFLTQEKISKIKDILERHNESEMDIR